MKGPIEQVARVEAEEAEGLLRDLGIPVLQIHLISFSLHSLFLIPHIILYPYIFIYISTLLLPVVGKKVFGVSSFLKLTACDAL